MDFRRRASAALTYRELVLVAWGEANLALDSGTEARLRNARAIVEHALASGSTRPMHLYWGGRLRSDLYLDALAQEWAREHAQLRYIPVLSEPDAGDGWAGRNGLVHEAVMADFPDLSAYQVYVCGAPAMVAAARRDFITHCALPENEFIADSFEFANDAANNPSAPSPSAG